MAGENFLLDSYGLSHKVQKPLALIVVISLIQFYAGLQKSMIGERKSFSQLSLTQAKELLQTARTKHIFQKAI